MPMTKSNRERIGRDGTVYPAHTQEIGWLKEGTQDRTSPGFDSLSEWSGGTGFIEARIPWGLLGFSDPSSKSIVSTVAGLRLGSYGTPVTDGMRFVLAEYSGDAFGSRARALRTVPAPKAGTIPLPPLFTWKEWDEPTYHLARKKSFAIYQEALRRIPPFLPEN